MNNVTKIVKMGMCTGCGACDICEHITFQKNSRGFPAPVVDDGCSKCGDCLKSCVFDPDKDEE